MAARAIRWYESFKQYRRNLKNEQFAIDFKLRPKMFHNPSIYGTLIYNKDNPQYKYQVANGTIVPQ